MEQYGFGRSQHVFHYHFFKSSFDPTGFENAGKKVLVVDVLVFGLVESFSFDWIFVGRNNVSLLGLGG